MARFRTTSSRSGTSGSPAALFHDLSDRADSIKYLWAHQKELLDAYSGGHLDSSDVALELPTGAGKTLVGLLIAEFRRRAYGERVAYMCPTRQLVRQVGAQAESYGIPANVFVGRQRDYDPAAFASFQQGELTAVTTYSSVFNVNPRIDRANVLIFDDAHSSETYLTGMWSLDIEREDNLKLFNAIVGLFREWLPESFLADDSPYLRSELIPSSVVRGQSARLI